MMPARFLRGVGDLEPSLARLGIRTVRDALFTFPRRYESPSSIQLITDLKEGEAASIVARVEDVEGRTTTTGRHMLCALLRDESDWLRAIWFDQPYMQQRLRVGQMLQLTGRPGRNGLRWEMVHPQMTQADSPANVSTPGLLPVYRLTEGVKQSRMRRIMAQAVERFAELVPEVLPEGLRRDHALVDIVSAIRQIHGPVDETSLSAARRRLAFQELFVQQLAFGMRRKQLQSKAQAISIEVTPQVHARILRRFPFALTPGQRQVIAEMVADLRRTIPMSRLLHGDVGSGKTVVAVYVMLAAVAARCQVALMAPTEILAQQHLDTLSQMLRDARVRLAGWTGAQSSRERDRIRKEVQAGKVDIVIGTQALIQSEVEFNRLGLVIVDEQHRFGVRQRAGLTQGNVTPHYLVMTATPIPRTMALLAYGDLDVSRLQDAPAGRQPVHTYRITQDKQVRWWDFVRRQLREGRQAFVIVPRVAGDESARIADLQSTYESLCHGELAEFRIDIVHGQMSAEEKLAVMRVFRGGQGHVLLASSVVEIGIDVPNASVMAILNAEQFGLAQLHQLRGRVGRGAYPGYVGLFCDQPTPAAEARLQSLVANQDGFALAELDLAQRGPGEFFGTRQHGVAHFRIARLPEDAVLLDEARAAAMRLLSVDENLTSPEYGLLRKQVLARYGKRLELGQIG